MADKIDDIAEQIAQRTTELILQNLYKRCRDEMSVNDVCREFGISRETIRRRIKAGLIPRPDRKRGRNVFSRTSIENAEFRGLL